MTRHLLSQGCQRIAFAGAQLDPRVLQRLEGYRHVLLEAACHDPALEYLSAKASSMALGGELLSDIQREHPDVDAVFFCNDDLAQGGVLAALRLGLKVPEQLAIAGFNDLAGSDQMWPPLTTIRTPRVQIGESAATMLLQRMRGEAVAQSSVDLGWALVKRGST